MAILTPPYSLAQRELEWKETTVSADCLWFWAEHEGLELVQGRVCWALREAASFLPPVTQEPISPAFILSRALC